MFFRLHVIYLVARSFCACFWKGQWERRAGSRLAPVEDHAPPPTRPAGRQGLSDPMGKSGKIGVSSILFGSSLAYRTLGPVSSRLRLPRGPLQMIYSALPCVSGTLRFIMANYPSPRACPVKRLRQRCSPQGQATVLDGDADSSGGGRPPKGRFSTKPVLHHRSTTPIAGRTSPLGTIAQARLSADGKRTYDAPNDAPIWRIGAETGREGCGRCRGPSPQPFDPCPCAPVGKTSGGNNSVWNLLRMGKGSRRLFAQTLSRPVP